MDKDKELCCREIGPDCDFLACGKTEDEVLRKAAQHAQAAHGIEGFSKDLYERAKSSIREGYCIYGDAETDETISEECSECYDECSECGDECCS